MQWVQGHSNIPSNDLADRAAKNTTTIASHTYHPRSLSWAFRVINELLHDDPPTKVQVKEVYRKISVDLRDIKP